MNRLIKLLSIIIISTSVYYIYNYTNNSKYVITSIGDKYSLNPNGYIDKFRKYQTNTNKKVIVDTNYSQENQSISQTLLLIKNTNKIKKIISESDIIIITLGYNDLLYEVSINENKDSQRTLNKIKSNYNELINEITKYYHKDIIVIGYYKNKNSMIKELNNILKSNHKVNYIDTYYLLQNRNKYFEKETDYYPNSLGNNEITNKIISKTLEIS